MAARGDGTTQFDALAGLRGIAALAVLEWHGQDLFGVSWLPAGYLAVDFFFLLSGWVLAHAYDARLAAGMPPARFLTLRLIRLYPVYVPALLLAGLVGLVTGANPLPGLLAGLLFLPDFWGLGRWLVAPAWSLAAELLANAGFSLFHRKLDDRLLIAVIGIAGIVLVATAFARGDLNEGATVASWPAMLPRAFFSFPLGVLLYRHRARVGRWSPAWSAWPSFLLLPAILAVPAAGSEATRDIVIVVVALPLVLLFASRSSPSPATAQLASLLGAMSYPLYLLHRPSMQLLDALLGPGSHRLSAPLSITCVCALVLLCLAVDRYYDQPARRWLVNRAAQRTVRAAGQAA